MAAANQERTGFLKSTFPVLVPSHPALTYKNEDFESFLKKDVKKFDTASQHGEAVEDESDDHADTLVSGTASTTQDVRECMTSMTLDAALTEKTGIEVPEHPFMKAMHSSNELLKPNRDMSGMMLTENDDLAHASTNEPLVDLFSELEELVSGPRLREILESAWQRDPLATLKIIFNARSIHIGKSSRATMYRCFGWLAQNHPVTLLVNLQWLTRPIIDKKMGEKKKALDDDEMVLVEPEKDENDCSRFDVKDGVAHGYWKDLLNILALAADGKLDVLAAPRDLLNVDTRKEPKSKLVWDAAKAKDIRREKKNARHAAAVKAFDESSFYSALHLTIARLFAEQLKTDIEALRSNDKARIRRISLCAKWAPSMGLFHDKYTFIVSSIAELLHPQAEFASIDDRELYLRHAREAYRKDVSTLRKSLEVVERDIAAEKFDNIKYERVPSLAMDRYAPLFAKKDTERFDRHIQKVADSKSRISGATLLPSKLVASARKLHHSIPAPADNKKGAKALVEAKLADIDEKVLDGQWNSLVQRIKVSGKLENAIAVADVSGSMSYPILPDKTVPMDTSIGLALLLAEITAPPFGGSFISFSENPKVERVQGKTFREKVQNLESSSWGYSTDFEAVFTRLILPLAVNHQLKQEDMVKQIFVFSDMHFNEANQAGDTWATSFERIKKSYRETGYEMPQLIFWNLAGGRSGSVAPKPVTADDEGCALVSGYSQGLLKVFLDNGSFGDPEAEEEIVEEEAEGGEIVQVQKKVKTDPMSTVRKAISHKSYSMLSVVD